MKLFVRAFLSVVLFISCKTAAQSQAIPDFNIKSLIGKSFERRDIAGRITLVYFWASWCGPCQRQLPTLDKFFLDHSGKGLQVLGINEDSEIKAAQAFLQSSSTPHFPILTDLHHQFATNMQIRALPTLILVTSDGEIGGVVEGPNVAGQDALLEKARALLIAQP